MRGGMAGRKRGLAALLLLVMAAAVALIASPALAVHELEMQLDGNLQDDQSSPDPEYDWEDIFSYDSGPDVTSPVDPLPAGFVSAAFIRDYVPGASGPDLSTFTTGSKDTLDISQWSCAKSNNVNQKTDVLNAYATVYVDTQVYLYFALERYNAGEGDAAVGFWFLQDPTVNCVPSGGGGTAFTGNHKDGDLLVVADFTNGGSVDTVTVYQWVGDGTSGSLDTANPVAVGADCDATSGAHDVCGNTNSANISTTWPAESSVGSMALETLAFFEGSLNLTALLGEKVSCFGGFLGGTRSSPAPTATIFDYAMGDISTCGSVTAHKYRDVNGNGQKDTGEAGLSGWSISLYEGATLVDTQVTDAAGNVVFEGLEAGSYTVCETLTGGWVNTDPGGGGLCKTITLDPAEDEVVQFGNGDPSITVSKSCTPNAFLGDPVSYSIVVTNDGNVDLANVTVVDALLGLNQNIGSLAAGASQTVPASYTPGATGAVTNTVNVTGGYGAASVANTATCTSTIWDLSVSKTAVPTWDVVYDWTISKTVTPAAAEIFENDTQALAYAITVTRSVASEAFGMTGGITITNPAPISATLSAVTDLINGSASAPVTCPSMTVPAGGSLTCTYAASGMTQAQMVDAQGDGSNTATVTRGSVTRTHTVNYNLSAPTSLANDTASVSDATAMDAGLTGSCTGDCTWPQAVTDSDSFSYTLTVGSANAGAYGVDNTATVTFDSGSDSDSTTATVTVRDLTVTKTATLAFTRTYDWSITKSASPATAEIFENDTQDLDYTITVDRSILSDAYMLTGTINVTNNAAATDAIINSVSDLAGAEATTVTCAVTFPYTLGAGATLTCSYSLANPAATTGTNTATAENANRHWGSGGTATLLGTDTGYSGSAGYAAGAPTEINATASVSDATTMDAGLSGICSGDCTWPQAVTDDDSFSYTLTVGSANAGTYDVDNTATVTFATGSDSDSAAATVDVRDLTVTKTADATWERTYDWVVAKTATPATMTLIPGGSDTAFYTITATRTEVSNTYGVSGTITVTNNNSSKATPVTVTDSIGATVVCPDTTVAAGGSMVCTYAMTAAGPSGSNTGTAQNQNRHWSSGGSSLGNLGTTGYSGNASYSLSAPTSEVDETATVGDVITCPAGFTCTPSDPGPWNFTDSGSVSYSVTITAGPNVLCVEHQVPNVATLTEGDSAETHTAAALVIPTVECAFTHGKTIGYWANRNGNHTLEILYGTPDDGLLPDIVIGDLSGRHAVVHNIDESNEILAFEGCDLFSPTACGANSLANKLKPQTFNNLAAQTLGLTYNIMFWTDPVTGDPFAGQALADLGCTDIPAALAALGLSTASTVQEVLDVANSLVANSGPGGTTTQAQAGAMVNLLGGCVNVEP